MKIEVSVGEAVDKLTILMIKARWIKDEKKLVNVMLELDMITVALSEAHIEVEGSAHDLLEVNQHLWRVEDRIRSKDAREEFDAEFIELARQVYRLNDHRAELKSSINRRYNSLLVEEKQYEKY